MIESRNIIALYSPVNTIGINSILYTAESFNTSLLIIISDDEKFDCIYNFTINKNITIPCIVIKGLANFIISDYKIIAVERKDITTEDLMAGSDMPTNLIYFEHPDKAIYLFYDKLSIEVSDNLDDMIFIPANNLLNYESAISTVLYDRERKEVEEYENEFDRPDDDTRFEIALQDS